MTPAPGTTITVSDSPTSRTAPTDTGVLFAVGIAESGPLTPTEIRSLSAFQRIYGDRQTNSLLYDYLDVAFREGLERAVVQRAVGVTPVKAGVDLSNGTAATLRVNAKYVGAGGNRLSVKVNTTTQDATIPAGSFVIIVLKDGVEVERSPVLADEATAVAWSAAAVNVDVVDQAATGDPVAVTTAAALTGGTDDNATISLPQWQAALDAIPSNMGPGQIAIPGINATAVQAAMLLHAQARNRFALLDAPDGLTAAQLAGSGVLVRANSGAKAARYGATHANWVTVPGLVAGTTRAVPFNAVRAGQIARMDALGNPNEPAAGQNGQSRFALALTHEWSDAERETLNDAGVDVAITLYGGVRDYGWRTLADPSTDANWVMASNVRTVMAIAAQADAVAETYVFRQVDGRGHTISAFKGDLVGMLLGFFDRGALFGDTPDEAFAVDTSPAVNTVENLAQGVLSAVIALRVSPFAERVVIEISKVPVDQTL